MTRQEDIVYSFLENDRIWPPFIASNPNHPFMKALVEVLKRLPGDAYDIVERSTSFVVEDSQIVATNVPFTRVYKATPNGFKVQFDTIVVFHQALRYTQSALVGLLAHEIAHGLVSQPDYETDEQEADALTKQWGFDEELEALRTEKEKLA